MEYTLQAIYYFIRAFINLLLQMKVAEGVTVGGILFSVILITVVLVNLRLTVSKADDLKVNGITNLKGFKKKK